MSSVVIQGLPDKDPPYVYHIKISSTQIQSDSHHHSSLAKSPSSPLRRSLVDFRLSSQAEYVEVYITPGPTSVLGIVARWRKLQEGYAKHVDCPLANFVAETEEGFHGPMLSA